jgi:hypothetical protein
LGENLKPLAQLRRREKTMFEKVMQQLMRSFSRKMEAEANSALPMWLCRVLVRAVTRVAGGILLAHKP